MSGFGLVVDKPAKKSFFNNTNENIDWAKWTWNPVTGCKHGCKYCYARDIANRFYDEGFEPTFRPERLSAPYDTKISYSRKDVPGIRNVFVCSMADLFGDWVSNDWIQSIIDVTKDVPRWNYIFLTKNPIRYLEFEFPSHCWLGATGDIQSRVDNALDVFKQLKENGVNNLLFLSCEPLKEYITIGEYPYVDWVIVGGQSKTSGEPAFQPDWGWVEDLLQDCKESCIPVYYKPNLFVPDGFETIKEYPD